MEIHWPLEEYQVIYISGKQSLKISDLSYIRILNQVNKDHVEL